MQPNLETQLRPIADSGALNARTILALLHVSRWCRDCMLSMPPGLLVTAFIEAVNFDIDIDRMPNDSDILRLTRHLTATLVCSDEVRAVLSPVFAQLCRDGFALMPMQYENFDFSVMSSSAPLSIALRKAVIDAWQNEEERRSYDPRLIACEKLTQADADAATTCVYDEPGNVFRVVAKIDEHPGRFTFRCAPCELAISFLNLARTGSRGSVDCSLGTCGYFPEKRLSNVGYMCLAHWLDVCGLGDRTVGVDESLMSCQLGDVCHHPNVFLNATLVASYNLTIYENHGGPYFLVTVRGKRGEFMDPPGYWERPADLSEHHASFSTYISPNSVRYLLANISEFCRPGLSISDAILILRQAEDH
jgi:hypothetical protein